MSLTPARATQRDPVSNHPILTLKKEKALESMTSKAAGQREPWPNPNVATYWLQDPPVTLWGPRLSAEKTTAGIFHRVTIGQKLWATTYHLHNRICWRAPGFLQEPRWLGSPLPTEGSRVHWRPSHSPKHRTHLRGSSERKTVNTGCGGDACSHSTGDRGRRIRSLRSPSATQDARG